jgi:hypothetical protein
VFYNKRFLAEKESRINTLLGNISPFDEHIVDDVIDITDDICEIK